MVLKTEHLTLSFPERENPVLRNLSLELDECEIGLVSGRAGSGKTLLGLTVCGFLPLWAGSWELHGHITLLGKRLNQGQILREVGVILENPYTQLSGMKRNVRQELAFSLECLGIEQKKMPALIEKYAGELGVAHVLDRNVHSLSGGELQRIHIASSFIARPRFIFLDRPLTEIDEEFRPVLMNIVRRNIEEISGAALVAEDPWLLPETPFQKKFFLDKGEERLPPRVLFSPEITQGKPSAKDGGLLIVEFITFSYNDIHPVINNLSFSLGAGDVSFLVGPNGAGKTTLAKLITGILKPSSGRIVINGKPSSKMTQREIMFQVGCAFQNPGLHLCRRTVREELELAEKWGNPAGKLIEILGLDTLLERHPLELTQAEKKRLGMALSCGGNRRILLLDEPSQYQDQDGFARVVGAVEMCAAQGKGILIITHDPRFFSMFPDAGIIRLSL